MTQEGKLFTNKMQNCLRARERILLPISLINNSTQRHGDAETLRKTGFNFEFSLLPPRLCVSASLRLSIDVTLQTKILMQSQRRQKPIFESPSVYLSCPNFISWLKFAGKKIRKIINKFGQGHGHGQGHENIFSVTSGIYIFLCALCVVLTGCQRDALCLKPAINYLVSERNFEKLPSPFPPLTPEESGANWAHEISIGRQFAKELDLYRAITCFKTALFLVPPDCTDRRLEIEYEIFLSYYIGGKYESAIEIVETGSLSRVTGSFPPIHDLLVALYDAYIKTDQRDKAERILCLIHSFDPSTAGNLTLETAIMDADFPTIAESVESAGADSSVPQFLCEYRFYEKSIPKARALNAVLPGAGYYYVGQKRAAVTSFLINALFIAASYQLFDRGLVPAAIITSSLEIGWYLGGINGAGLAAREYNERLYEKLGKETLIKDRLFPILMFEMGF